MSWTDDLVAALKAAIAADGETCTILVPNEAQHGLGLSALERMAPGAAHITFRVDPSVGSSAQLIREGQPGARTLPAPSPGSPLTDFLNEGPEEAQRIVREHRACETAPNSTGARCTCDFDCANYCLRAAGFKAL